MPSYLSMFRPGPSLRHPAEAIHRVLLTDEDVDGLIDLPIKDIVAALKAKLPGAKEGTGALHWSEGEETLSATWTWQHVRFAVDNLDADRRNAILDVAKEFHCIVYDAALAMRIPPAP